MSRSNHRRARRLGAKALTLSLGVFGMMNVGCYKGEDGPFGRSWLDQTELGRYPRQTLKVPIVKTLDSVAEGPDTKYSTARDVRPEDLVYTAQDYKLQPNDIVQVTIQNLQGPGIETPRPAEQITETGKITMPFVGELTVGGLTKAQAENLIRQAYRDADVVKDAPVTVAVLQARGRTYTVNGAVARPGRYEIDQTNFRLTQALASVGDLADRVGIDTIYVIRKTGGGDAAPTPSTAPTPTPGTNDPLAPTSMVPTADSFVSFQPETQPSGTTPPQRTMIVDGKEVPLGAADPVAPMPMPENPVPPQLPAEPQMNDTAKPFAFETLPAATDREVIRVPYDKIRQGDFRYDIVIRPGDYIYVPIPAAGQYYMGGHVNRPGGYAFNGQSITLSQALILAGGLDPIAWPDRCSIRRKISEDMTIIVRVDLGRVVDGVDPDIYLKTDDQVSVGSNAIAPFIAALRNAFRITYGFGFLYDKNFASDFNNN